MIDFYSKQADLININFKNSFLNKIIQVSKYDFMFYFSKGKNKNIFISLNNIFPFVFFNENKINLNLDTIFLKSLKKHLLNAKFLGSSLVNEDNILVFDFLKVEDTYDKSNYKLYIELFKLNSNIILTKEIKIIDCFHHKSLETKRPLINGILYEFPAKSQFFKEFSNKDRDFILKYCNNIEQEYLNEKNKKTISILKRRKKSLLTKIDKLKLEKNEAFLKSNYKEAADYFLTYKDELDINTIYNHNDFNIKLDPELSLIQNIEKLYKKYKKSKLTIASCDEQINKAQNEINYLESILNSLSFYNENDFNELILELAENKIIKLPSNLKSKKVKSAIKPYYLIYQGVKIGFGKNNIQNNYLTFTLANKNHYFLHINKDHGPHVIIFDENPNKKVIEFACELALFLAKKNDGDVIFTKVKTIKKGPALGLVILSTYETYHISKFKNDFNSLLNNLNRF